MTDLVNEWSWLILAVVGVAGALLSYVVNAHLQRGLERNKIQYETKNRAFKDITEAGRGLMNLIEAFRLTVFRLNNTRMEPVDTIITGAAIAQGFEKSMGSDYWFNIISRLESSFGPKLMDQRRDQAYKEEVAGALNDLHMLYTLLFSHYYERVATAFENAFIVMEEYDEFSNSVSEFTTYAGQLFESQKEALRIFRKNLQENMESVAQNEIKPDRKLLTLWNDVLDRMNEDLYQTL